MKGLAILILLVSLQAFSSVKIAFFERRGGDGRIIPIEPGGRFYHVAIQYKDGWINAHPFYGVIEVKDHREIGDLYSIIEIDKEIPLEKYAREIGKPFKMTDPWESKASTYCSKLVAELLSIPPAFMRNGLGLGLSPDDIYSILKAKNHSESVVCSKLFAR